MNIEWNEKYRPTTINEIKSQNDTIKSLKSVKETNILPHLLFFGPSGCGKTSTILALAKDLFKDKFEDRVIELNASDERGINVIRDKIKKYAQESITIDTSIPPWKLIILDEADSMTPESQYALRRIMEEYSKLTRFCIICNYHNKIIDPIISRCTIYRFKPISKDKIVEKLKEILIKENYNDKVDNIILNKIAELCEGDLRKSINYLQRFCSIDKFNIDDVYEMFGLINVKLLNKWLNYCLKNQEQKVIKIINKFSNDGFSIVNQIKEIVNILKKSNIESHKLSKIFIKITEIENNLLKGCDEYIQFIRLSYFIMVINHI
jgi:replication factor C subunit 2/4